MGIGRREMAGKAEWILFAAAVAFLDYLFRNQLGIS